MGTTPNNEGSVLARGPAPEPSPREIRLPHGESGSPKRPCHRVIGLLWPQPGMRKITPVHGKEVKTGGLDRVRALALGLGQVTVASPEVVCFGHRLWDSF